MTVAASQERHVQLCKEYWIAGHSPIVASALVGTKITQTRSQNGIQEYNTEHELIEFMGYLFHKPTIDRSTNIALYNHHLIGAAEYECRLLSEVYCHLRGI